MTSPLSPAIGYIRVGSPDPNILAGEFQKRRLEQWAAATGHEIVQWVEEFGVGRAGPAFDKAVAGCGGHVIVATAPDRISRHLTVLQERQQQVRAAGGQLGFVEGWGETLEQTVARWGAVLADAKDSGLRVVPYRRRPAGALHEAAPERQVAAIWDHLEQSGYEVVSVDDAKLGRDPRELLDEA